jgi:uracil-DNA glycosylase
MMTLEEGSSHDFEDLIEEISGCSVCRAFLQGASSPRVQISPENVIVIIGSSPDPHALDGSFWDSGSEQLLCSWLGVEPAVLRGDPRLGHLPLGFCCSAGNEHEVTAPPPVCAPLWHSRVFAVLPKISLKILVGEAAQRYYLGEACSEESSELERVWQRYLPDSVPLPLPKVPRGSDKACWESDWFVELTNYLSNRVSLLLGT